MFDIYSQIIRNTDGYIKFFGLKNWWFSAFTPAERKYIEKMYRPFGPDENTLVEGRVVSSNLTTLPFLINLVKYFDSLQDDQIAERIRLKIEEYINLEKSSAIDIHFYWSEQIEENYKKRKCGIEFINRTVMCCEKQIEISEKVAAEFRETWSNDGLPSHKGYSQLCIILEKQGKLTPAIKLAKQALLQGWAGDWDYRIWRLQGKY